jgi:hypothetical protein
LHENLDIQSNTFIIRLLNRPEALLAGSVPKLSLGNNLPNWICFDSEVYTDGSEVLLGEGTLCLTAQKGGLANATVACENNFKEHAVIVAHGYQMIVI